MWKVLNKVPQQRCLTAFRSLRNNLQSGPRLCRPSSCRLATRRATRGLGLFHDSRKYVSDSALQSEAPTSLNVRSLSSDSNGNIDTLASSMPGEPFKVLIANRGEIAGRVISTCRKLGFSTVAIYSVADAKAPYVSMADEAVCIGEASSSKSYLDVDKVMEAIKLTGAKAVHPGYGFLSENAKFAAAISESDQGLIWLGPPPSAINDMGDKIRSKQIAKEAGVDIIPGFEGTIESIDHAIQICHEDIGGYPVLLKAAAGGGGKGMRVCYNDDDIRSAYPMAKAEAINYFSDDRLLVEKYIENPHHIEFQVLCSSRKNPNTAAINPFPIIPEEGEVDVVVFPERECSIQRRNQKIIEESPSCLLTEETRQKMARQVRKLCKKVGYESAGTVEWLVDENQNFYFLEMNTRLQVEHPVTEMICDVDLVKGMLWVGAGWGFPEEFEPYLKSIKGDKKEGKDSSNDAGGESDPNINYVYPYRGHAIEARIYAEDPVKGFLPSTGPLLPYVEPPQAGIGSTGAVDSALRLDSGVVQGHIVTPFYDPMLSKIIYYDSTSRTKAINGLRTALDQYIIEGVQHNARLVNDILRMPRFIDGETPTSFLPQQYPSGEKNDGSGGTGQFTGVKLAQGEQEELAVAMAVLHDKLKASSGSDGTTIVKLGGMFGDAYKVTINAGNASIAKLSEDGEGEENIIALDAPIQYKPETYLAEISLNGVSRYIQVLQEDNNKNSEFHVQMYGALFDILVHDDVREYELSKFIKPPPKVDTSNIIQSPMPGTLVNYCNDLQEGDYVEEGQDLCIIEAMKMQNIIKSTRNGTILKLPIAEGSSVMANQIIVEFDKKTDEDDADAA